MWQDGGTASMDQAQPPAPPVPAPAIVNQVPRYGTTLLVDAGACLGGHAGALIIRRFVAALAGEH